MAITRWSSGSLVACIKRAHASNPWFSEQGNLIGLTQHSCMWNKGTVIVVPADAELGVALQGEMHDARLAGHLGVCKTHAAVSMCIGGPSGTPML